MTLFKCSVTIGPTSTGGINGIKHRSLMQTDKFQPEGKRIMPETRFPAFSIDPRVGISRSASESFTYGIKNYYVLFGISFIYDI